MKLYSKTKRFLNLAAWQAILNTLEMDKVLDIPHPNESGDTLSFLIVPAFWVCDHPEAQNTANCYAASGSNFPCQICLCPKDSMSNFDALFPLRSDEICKKVIERNRNLPKSSQVSLGFHLDCEALHISVPFKNGIYLATPPCASALDRARSGL